MSTQQFRSTKFKPDSLVRIGQINDILSEYQDQKLTARQVYYQLVSRGIIENNVRSYKNLTNLLTDARYAGLVDWDVIEDRGRVPDHPSEWSSLEGLVDAALRSYRLPRWEEQENYVELWVEKQALAGVLTPIASKYHVTLMVNKGYSSASSMKDAADRMIQAADDYAGDEDRRIVLLYCGDHDPSGEDMVRDIGARLEEFGVRNLDVRKLALTMAQVEQFNPPPNPAKLTDSRAKGYIDKFGDSSWELDALPPRELNRIIERAILSVLDVDKMDEVKAREEQDKERLRAALKGM